MTDPTYICHRSGHCCRAFDLKVSQQELETMQGAGPTFRTLRVVPHPDGKRVVILNTDCLCPWYDEKMPGCSIYAHRPAVCRSYLCFRRAPDEPYHLPDTIVAFFEQHPDARVQAETMREEAMEYARSHGWDDL